MARKTTTVGITWETREKLKRLAEERGLALRPFLDVLATIAASEMAGWERKAPAAPPLDAQPAQEEPQQLETSSDVSGEDGEPERAVAAEEQPVKIRKPRPDPFDRIKLGSTLDPLEDVDRWVREFTEGIEG